MAKEKHIYLNIWSKHRPIGVWADANGIENHYLYNELREIKETWHNVGKTLVRKKYEYRYIGEDQKLVTETIATEGGFKSTEKL